jgi:secreted PhoX family phosphatase
MIRFVTTGRTMADTTTHPPTAAGDDGSEAARGLTRRGLLGGGAASALGLAMSGSLGGLARAGGAEAAVAAAKPTAGVGYGPLVTDPVGLLSLPKRFRYTVVAESGVTTLEGGGVSPDNYDGTAAFARPGGGSILVANHEIRAPGSYQHGVPHVAGVTYDPGVEGGTTTIEVDDAGARVREYVSLAGSSTNCAGGRTPWNTWLTCEETFAPANATKPHGYVFEVDPFDQAANQEPAPIVALGRFEHEAVAVDPDTGQIYETEDSNDPHGLLYRWTPPVDAVPLGRGSLGALADDAGVLEAMQAFDRSGAWVPDLCVATSPGTTYDVVWKAVPNHDPATLADVIRKQFNGRWGNPLTTYTDRPGGNITRSRKLEGAWWGDGGAYVVASFARTGDGSEVQHDGQVWFLDPLEHTITLKLRFAYTTEETDPDGTDPDGPDNITVSPYGGVILAEDGEGRQHLVGANAAGDTYFLARNEVGDGSGEMTGPTYSADKSTLFANLFHPGHVYAITGPWRRIGKDG